MPRPQFTALLVAMLIVGAFLAIVRACVGPLALFLLIVWGAFGAGCIGARWSSARALLAAFFAFFFLPPIWAIVAGSLGLID
jgi:hypothetical protein